MKLTNVRGYKSVVLSKMKLTNFRDYKSVVLFGNYVIVAKVSEGTWPFKRTRTVYRRNNLWRFADTDEFTPGNVVECMERLYLINLK